MVSRSRIDEVNIVLEVLSEKKETSIWASENGETESEKEKWKNVSSGIAIAITCYLETMLAINRSEKDALFLVEKLESGI